jgi:hypothetical protein
VFSCNFFIYASVKPEKGQAVGGSSLAALSVGGCPGSGWNGKKIAINIKA